jgi:hypothetical protein
MRFELMALITHEPWLVDYMCQMTASAPNILLGLWVKVTAATTCEISLAVWD